MKHGQEVVLARSGDVRAFDIVFNNTRCVLLVYAFKIIVNALCYTNMTMLIYRIVLIDL